MAQVECHALWIHLEGKIEYFYNLMTIEYRPVLVSANRRIKAIIATKFVKRDDHDDVTAFREARKRRPRRSERMRAVCVRLRLPAR